jgi:hypothetical protein
MMGKTPLTAWAAMITDGVLPIKGLAVKAHGMIEILPELLHLWPLLACGEGRRAGRELLAALWAANNPKKRIPRFLGGAGAGGEGE